MKAEQLTEYNDTGDISFELLKDKIIVPVQLQGKTYQFLVDTGGIFEISERIQKEFNFVEAESTTIIDINKTTIEIKTVMVPQIQLGNWTFANRKAIVSDLTEKYPYSCFQLDGMIGRDFFDEVLLHFDYATKTFRLTENDSALELDNEHRTKMKLSRRGLPDIKMKINGKNQFVEFDSGSGDLYSPKSSDVSKRKNKVYRNEILEFHGKFSFGVTMDHIQPTSRFRKKIESLQIATVHFTNFYSNFSKASAARIGARIVKYGTVTVDYKNGWFYYQPYTQKQVIEPFISFGFDVAINDGFYKVKYILKGSEADRLGLEPGNSILMMNGTVTQNLKEDCNGYLYGYDYKKNNSIVLTFLNNQQQEKKIKLSSQQY